MKWKKWKNLLSRKLSGRGGYSFAEALLALMIVLLVSNSMVAGVRFAIQEYHKSMILSESRVLLSTLTDIITDELSNIDGTVDLTQTPIRYHSRNFAQQSNYYVSFWSVASGEDSADEDAMAKAAGGFGVIAVGVDNGNGTIKGHKVLSDAAYSLYQIKAKVAVDCDLAHNLFHVTLVIRSPGNEDYTSRFDVLCLSDVEQDPGI